MNNANTMIDSFADSSCIDSVVRKKKDYAEFLDMFTLTKGEIQYIENITRRFNLPSDEELEHIWRVYEKQQRSALEPLKRTTYDEIVQYFEDKEPKKFPTVIEDSHYNPKDKNCLLNNTRPSITIRGFPRYYS